jgi:hypothetical protein
MRQALEHTVDVGTEGIGARRRTGINGQVVRCPRREALM